MTPGRTVLLVSLLAGVLCGCDPPPAGEGPAAEPPARVVQEDDLNIVVLTAKAQGRLGISTTPVERREVIRTRTLGGDVRLPPGLEITVKSPLAGEILAASLGAMSGAGDLPRPGERLESEQEVVVLRPFLSPEAMISYRTLRVEATGAVEQGKVELEAAKVVLDRAEKLLRAKGGSQRDVDEARARLLAAQARLEAALAERTLLERVEADTSAGAPTTIAIRSPLRGMLLSTHARPGQAVEAGAPLFTVAGLDRLWIRVPVYAGDLARFDETAAVQIRFPGAAPGARTLGQGRPVAAPPSADPAASTVDLFYEIAGESGSFRPGQKVGVTIPLRSESESLVVPWSAVVHDVYGGTWVYEQIGERRFARRRVEVRHVDGELAILSAGPAPGALVVTAGVAELFGTEFGIGK